LGATPNGSRPYAEGTQLVIDEEVSRLLAEASDRARAILVERRRSLDAVIDLLLEKETISGTELMDAVRRTVATQSVTAPS
jgi:cell division protease FtsH